MPLGSGYVVTGEKYSILFCLAAILGCEGVNAEGVLGSGPCAEGQELRRDSKVVAFKYVLSTFLFSALVEKQTKQHLTNSVVLLP